MTMPFSKLENLNSIGKLDMVNLFCFRHYLDPNDTIRKAKNILNFLYPEWIFVDRDHVHLILLLFCEFRFK